MLETTKANLEKNGFEVLVVENGWQAFDLAKAYLKEGMSVGLGGSTTVAEIGLLNYLETKPLGITLFNQYEKGISMEENTRRRREGMLADLYITGCNAITEAGELVNADGSGNRVAAQIFGPKKLLLIAGTNKLVPTLEAGFERIKNVAGQKNIDRMNAKAIEMGKEPRYNWDNIANKFAYINSDEPGRTTIILVKESLGY
ncbi:lactate utilization protein [Sulfurospirillum sp. T05]|uniref:Lactate utilization protein n=1 Tax=Sulfurospirillum tamanense TaxID=2813362 RepID=A0ABS2WUD6_9BACT|nr:lactate utilization protein [Sulfurospirillum tamanensis]MBN2965210.1 lactate utilization protein [Sulfurospirillum tamanensis]